MLGLSRWAGPGGSYRTVQRFFSTVIPWATLCWEFFRHHMYRTEDVYLLAGDEVVVTKAGTHTHGLDRFFSRLDGKPGPGLACFTWSLVSTQERCSFPLRGAQRRKRPARPKQRPGRRNRPAPNVALGVRRGASTPTQRKGPSPRSDGPGALGATLSCNWSPGISR